MAERLLLGLFAALPASLVLGGLLHLRPPPGSAALAQRPDWVVWTLIAAWLLLGLVLAGAGRRPGRLWRWALQVSGASLLVAAALGLALHTPLAVPVATALVLVAAAAFGLARCVNGRRLTPVSWPVARPLPRAGAAPRQPWSRLNAAGFWLAGGLMAEGFRLAHIVNVDPMRGTGMLTMLLAFFAVLPAVSLAAWYPRVCAAVLAAAALAFAALAWKSALVPPALASLLLTALAIPTAWRRAVDAA